MEAEFEDKVCSACGGSEDECQRCGGTGIDPVPRRLPQRSYGKKRRR